jgi:mannosyl-oligosaccharide alpha-1,2-mannosidase
MLCSIRNLCYIATISLLLYGLFFIAATKEPTDYLPDYLKPKVHQRPSIWPRRADSVKAAFVHAYHGYEKYAAPHDELRPITKVGSNHYNGWGVTAFDALDTMLLMDLKDEYMRAVRIVEMADFNQTTKDFIPYFETVIRYLGGLLSAYAISPNQSLLTRAEELAAILDPVFDTPSGMPQYGVYTTKFVHSLFSCPG